MKENWKKGFRRVALICAVLAAIAGGVLGFKIVDNNARKSYEARLKDEITVLPSSIVEYWKGQSSFGWENQKDVWKDRTGEDLEESFKRSAVVENDFWKKHPSLTNKERFKEHYYDDVLPYIPKAVRSGKSSFDVGHTWTLPEERIEHLKEQGWQTVNGEVLPYTPEKVASMLSRRWTWELRKEAEQNLEVQLRYRPLGIAVGSAVSFIGVWIVYLILVLLVSWLARGFHGVITEQKSGDTDKQVTKC